MEKKREFTWILALVIISVIQRAKATDYLVGGLNGGWDTGGDLEKWASSKKFYPGDTLTFTYQPFHDLLEVTEANFEKCSTDDYFAFYIGGTTTIDLTSPGSRYFICGIIGHCSGGMKVEVDVLYPSSPPPPPSLAPPPALPPKQNSTAPPPKQNSTAPPPKKNNTSPPPPSKAPSRAPKVAPKPSPTPSSRKASSPAPVPLMAPAPAPFKSASIARGGIDKILMVIMGLVIPMFTHI